MNEPRVEPRASDGAVASDGIDSYCSFCGTHHSEHRLLGCEQFVTRAELAAERLAIARASRAELDEERY